MQTDAQLQEQDRLNSLDRYDVLDTPSEEGFDRITRLTRRLFDVSMSTITFIDGHRQWFKSQQGMAIGETSKEQAFCDVAMRGTGPLVVPDALADSRYSNNPFVLGDPHIRFYAGVPLRTPDGHNIGTLSAMDSKPRNVEIADIEVLSDLANIVMNELELRMLATTDELTNALSRRAFREEAGRAIALALRHGHALSCVCFDLDHFKAINDGHGHAMGDLVLRESVATCVDTLRQSDLLGRMGGEEFAILLPHTGVATAMKVAEKVRAAVAALPIIGTTGKINVSASFGVSTLGQGVGDIDELLRRADIALYAAKAGGRNRCVEWLYAESAPPNIRRRVLKAGLICFNGGRSTIDCTVRNLSPASAGLDVISVDDVPERFKLVVRSDALHRACRIVAKREKHVDVEFW
jgi:diguanylate cyclase (GGDEF)-like protein